MLCNNNATELLQKSHFCKTSKLISLPRGMK